MNTVILTLVLGLGMVESLSVVEIREGDTLTLYCPLYVSNNSIILWSKGDRLLFVGDLKIKQDQRYAVVNDNLMVSDIEPADAGTFECQVEDEKKELNVFSYQVTILKSADARIDVGSYLAVKAGTSLALRCVGSGVPVPEVVWRRGGEVMSRGVGEAGILLEYITREDAGDIVCEASNGVGHDTARDVLALDVLYAPEVEMMEPHISFQPKCGLELQCQVHSSSDPTVSWYHNDLLLQPEDGVTIWSLDNLHVLQISSCDHSIIGHFSCRATNNLGQGEAEADISYQWLQQELDLFKQEDEEVEDINNVRRNVRQEHSLPLTSSSSSVSAVSIFALSLLIFI